MPQTNVATHAAACFLPLPLYAFLCCEGARAAEFLQGQLTCDLRGAVPGRVIPGACCTIQGRVASSFLLWQPDPARVLLRLRADIAGDTAARLAKYAVFSRTRVAEASPALTVIGLLGAAAESLPSSLVAAWPMETLALQALEDGWLLRRDDALHELWIPAATATSWLARLSAHLEEGRVDDWNAALVTRAEAEIQAATREQFLPQMLGYDQSGAVSFRKGCYTGQEVVARTQYKGAVKRRLRRLQGECTQPPPPGSGLRAGERSVGTVVESALTAPGSCALLAVLADDAADKVGTLITDDGQARLRVAG